MRKQFELALNELLNQLDPTGDNQVFDQIDALMLSEAERGFTQGDTDREGNIILLTVNKSDFPLLIDESDINITAEKVAGNEDLQSALGEAIQYESEATIEWREIPTIHTEGDGEYAYGR